MKRTHLSLAIVLPLLGSLAPAAVLQVPTAAVQFDLSPVYNIDGVANLGDRTQSALDSSIAVANFVLPTQSVATSFEPILGDGLRDDGLYPSNAFHPDMQLGYGLNPNGNNVLQFIGSRAVSFSVTPGHYQEVHVAATSGAGDASFRLVFHYADGNVFTGTVVVRDWIREITEDADEYYLVDGLDRVKADQSEFRDSNFFAVYGFRFETDENRELLSIELIGAGDGRQSRLNVFGATGVMIVPEPVSTTLLTLGLGLCALRRRRGFVNNFRQNNRSRRAYPR